MFSVFSVQVSVAHETVQPTSYEQYGARVKTQKFYRVKGSKVAWADFDRIRENYPELRNYSSLQIEEWLLANFARVSELQLLLRGIRSSHFEVDENDVRTFIHPPEYNRASVGQGYVEGHPAPMLFDLKGTGHADEVEVRRQVKIFGDAKGDQSLIDRLRLEHHNDGLMLGGEGLAEIIRSSALQAGHDLGMFEGETVEPLFLIDLGFDILKEGNRGDPAAVIGREPHFRGNSFPAPKDFYLDPKGFFQRSVTGAEVDMGSVEVTLKSLANYFKFLGDGRNPQYSRPWMDGDWLMKLFRQRSVSPNHNDTLWARSELYNYMKETLSPVWEAWQAVRFKKSDRLDHFYSARNLFRNMNSRLRDSGLSYTSAWEFAFSKFKSLQIIHDPSFQLAILSDIKKDESLFSLKFLMRLIEEGGTHSKFYDDYFKSRLQPGSGASEQKRFIIREYLQRVQGLPFDPLASCPVILHHRDGKK